MAGSSGDRESQPGHPAGEAIGQPVQGIADRHHRRRQEARKKTARRSCGRHRRGLSGDLGRLAHRILETLGDTIRQRAYGLGRSLGVKCHLGSRVDGLPQLDRNRRSEAVLFVVVEAHRHDADTEGPEAGLSAQHDARGAALQGELSDLAVAHTLGEERDGAAARQDLVATRERIRVPSHVDSRVAAAVDAQGPRQEHERPHDRVGEERALGEHARPHPRESQQEEGVHHGVVVVGHEDQGRLPWDPVQPRPLELSKEDMNGQTGKGRDRLGESTARPAREAVRRRRFGRSGLPRVASFGEGPFNVGRDEEYGPGHEQHDERKERLAVRVRQRDDGTEDDGPDPRRSARRDLVDGEEGRLAARGDHLREEGPRQGLGPAQNRGR